MKLVARSATIRPDQAWPGLAGLGLGRVGRQVLKIGNIIRSISE